MQRECVCGLKVGMLWWRPFAASTLPTQRVAVGHAVRVGTPQCRVWHLDRLERSSGQRRASPRRISLTAHQARSTGTHRPAPSALSVSRLPGAKQPPTEPACLHTDSAPSSGAGKHPMEAHSGCCMTSGPAWAIPAADQRGAEASCEADLWPPAPGASSCSRQCCLLRSLCLAALRPSPTLLLGGLADPPGQGRTAAPGALRAETRLHGRGSAQMIRTR